MDVKKELYENINKQILQSSFNQPFICIHILQIKKSESKQNILSDGMC